MAGIAGALLASNAATGLAIDSQNKAEVREAKRQFVQAKQIVHNRFREGGLSFQEKELWIDTIQTQRVLCGEPLQLVDVNSENLAEKLNDSLLEDC